MAECIKRSQMPTVRKPNHAALVKACLEWLHLNGIAAWPQNVGAKLVPATATNKRRFVRFGHPGLSDIGGILLGGKALYVECKVGRDKVKPDQECFLAMVNEFGGVGIVARSVDDLLCLERVER